MGTFAIYLSPPGGQAVLKEPRRNPDDLIHLEPEDISDWLGFPDDPYVSNRVWPSHCLMELVGILQERLAVRQRQVEEAVCRRVNQAQILPWMQGMLDESQRSDRILGITLRLLQMVTRAEETGGTLVFWGD